MGRLKDEKSQKIYVRKLRLLLVLNQSKLTSKQKKKIKKFRKILRNFNLISSIMIRKLRLKQKYRFHVKNVNCNYN